MVGQKRNYCNHCYFTKNTLSVGSIIITVEKHDKTHSRIQQASFSLPISEGPAAMPLSVVLYICMYFSIEAWKAIVYR